MIISNDLYTCIDRVGFDEFKQSVLTAKISGKAKVALMNCLENSDSEELFIKAIYEILEAERAFKKTEQMTIDIKEWVHLLAKEVEPPLEGYSSRTIDTIIHLLLVEQFNRDLTFGNLLLRFSELMKGKGGVY